jgi:hypothetical protein
MNCNEFWNSIPEPGHAPTALHASHLQECSRCAKRLEMQRSLLRGLRTLAQETRTVGAPSRVESRLVARFRGHAGLEERPRRAWIPVVSWAAAAVLLAAIGLFLVRGRKPAEPVQRSSPRRVELASLGMGGRTSVTLSGFEGEFLPLPQAAEILPDEEVNLVRLEVPRSTLLALGMPVEPSRAAEAVEADFVLGADGRARAVRWMED